MFKTDLKLISYKLNLRGECEKFVDECEQYSSNLESSSLQALVSRWKLDWNEWNVETDSQTTTNGTQRIKKLQILLEITKV